MSVNEPIGKGQFQHRPLVFESVRKPEFLRVCEVLHGGSKGLIETRQRTPTIGRPFAQKRLFFTELADTPLIGGDQRRVVGGDDAVQKLAFLMFDLCQLNLEKLGRGPGGVDASVPQIADHMMDQLERGWFRPHLREKPRKFVFQHIPANRFAVAGAASALTQIIAVALAVPGC